MQIANRSSSDFSYSKTKYVESNATIKEQLNAMCNIGATFGMIHYLEVEKYGMVDGGIEQIDLAMRVTYVRVIKPE
jgi:hypothetical protein